MANAANIGGAIRHSEILAGSDAAAGAGDRGLAAGAQRGGHWAFRRGWSAVGVADLPDTSFHGAVSVDGRGLRG